MERQTISKVKRSDIDSTLLNIDARTISLSTFKTEYRRLIRRVLLKLHREPELNKKEDDRIN